MKDIEYLLEKYKHKQPQEKWSSKSEKEAKRMYRLNDYLAIADNITDQFHMRGIQKEEVKHIIKTVPLKEELCGNCKVETIIVAICIYVKKSYNSSFSWKKYKVVEEYGLTEPILITILCGLLTHYRRKILLQYTSPIGVDYILPE